MLEDERSPDDLTDNGVLVQARSLVNGVGHSGDREIKEALVRQYEVAMQRRDKKWVKEIRVRSDALVSNPRIDSNLP